MNASASPPSNTRTFDSVAVVDAVLAVPVVVVMVLSDLESVNTAVVVSVELAASSSSGDEHDSVCGPLQPVSAPSEDAPTIPRSSRRGRRSLSVTPPRYSPAVKNEVAERWTLEAPLSCRDFLPGSLFNTRAEHPVSWRAQRARRCRGRRASQAPERAGGDRREPPEERAGSGSDPLVGANEERSKRATTERGETTGESLETGEG